MSRLTDALETNVGKACAGALIVIALLSLFLSIKHTFGYSDGIAGTRSRVFVCSETGKSFKVDLKVGMTSPVYSPYSGKNTGYEPDEVCFWTADGHVKSDPTYVLLNHTIGKKGPTFCPDCGRLVVKNNPQAAEGMTPPPTKEEYMQTHHAAHAAAGEEKLTGSNP